MPLDDASIPIPAPNEVFVDRNRYITAKWYPWMVRLFKTLKTTINALDTVQETVDQVAGTWTLSINDNNRVTGYIKLDGSAVSTIFDVLADVFRVSHPSINGGTEFAPFVVQVIAGVPTMTFNGLLKVQDLSSLSANIGTVTAGRMQSTDGKMVVDLDNKEIRIET